MRWQLNAPKNQCKYVGLRYDVSDVRAVEAPSNVEFSLFFQDGNSLLIKFVSFIIIGTSYEFSLISIPQLFAFDSENIN